MPQRKNAQDYHFCDTICPILHQNPACVAGQYITRGTWLFFSYDAAVAEGGCDLVYLTTVGDSVYEMLAGKAPFPSESLYEVLRTGVVVPHI